MLFYKSENLNKLRKLITEYNINGPNASVLKSYRYNLVDIFKDGYWEIDFKTGYKYFSPELQKNLGYEEGELSHKTSTLESIIHPDDLDNIWTKLGEHIASKGKEPFKIIFRCATKDGGEVKILSRGQVVKWLSEYEPLIMVGTHIIIE